MHIPKQSIPVLRNLNSVSVSHNTGVNASLGRTELNRLFNRRGTCDCNDLGKARGRDGRWYRDISPTTNNCNRGFAPQCDQNAGCTCVDSRQVQSHGHFYIPTNPPKYLQGIWNTDSSDSD